MQEQPNHAEKIRELDVNIQSYEGNDVGTHFSDFVQELKLKYPKLNLESESLSSDKAYEAKAEGNIIGVLVGFVHGNGLMAQRMIVDPNFRNRGVGKSLMDAAKKDFSEIRGFPQPFKGTAPELEGETREQLIKMYKGWGFEVINEHGAVRWSRESENKETPS